MTTFDLWVGDLDDPNFSWEGYSYDRESGVEKAGAPRSLHSGLKMGSRESFSELTGMIYQGKLEGAETNPLCWVGVATKAKLLAFFKKHGSDATHKPGDEKKLNDFLESLENKKRYALVATEF